MLSVGRSVIIGAERYAKLFDFSRSVEELSSFGEYMALSKALIEQFQALHLAKYGERIDDEVAELQLKELAELVRITTPRKESKDAKALQS